mgnify:CR=1 FL=1
MNCSSLGLSEMRSVSQVRRQDLREDISQEMTVLCRFVKNCLDSLRVMNVCVPADSKGDQIECERPCHCPARFLQTLAQLVFGLKIRLADHATDRVVIVHCKRDWVQFLVATGAGLVN